MVRFLHWRFDEEMPSREFCLVAAESLMSPAAAKLFNQLAKVTT